jgi:hypothetical protein
MEEEEEHQNLGLFRGRSRGVPVKLAVKGTCRYTASGLPIPDVRKPLTSVYSASSSVEIVV